MQKTFFVVYIVVLLGVLLSIKSYASQDTFKLLDRNDDGVISIREAVAEPSLLAVFGQIDLDGNGEISLREFNQLKLVEKVESGKKRKQL